MATDEAAKRWALAGRLLMQGKIPAEAAAAVAPRRTACRWPDMLNADGLGVIRAAPVMVCSIVSSAS